MRLPILTSLLFTLAACAGGDDDKTDTDVSDDTESSDDTETTDDTEVEESDTEIEESDTEDTEVPGEPLDLTILHINDHHSHVDSDEFDFDVSGLGLAADLDEVSVEYGGFPKLVALFNELAGPSTTATSSPTPSPASMARTSASSASTSPRRPRCRAFPTRARSCWTRPRPHRPTSTS